MKTLTRATAVAVLTLGLAACGSKAEEASPPPTTSTTEAPTTSTTVEATTTTVYVPTDADLNLEWAPVAIEDATNLQNAFSAIADAAGSYDLAATRSACAELLLPAQTFADHAPDTEAGRHAKAAAALYIRAANTCIDGDLDGTTALMKAGGAEFDAATAAL